MTDDTPARLGLNPTETEVYNKMTARERTTFNAQPDDNAKTIFIRVLEERDRAWREKSKIIACLLQYEEALAKNIGDESSGCNQGGIFHFDCMDLQTNTIFRTDFPRAC
ncbi:hypothetical protein C1645_731657 [Glomus cerebriforme]|uniref:Uncharacterized protein n=1 Tax=Glomus cerebriforme TaxID=658196 RepID=A0A397TJP2_9GLOM|nr:hypothetical protein C1645_731657 [Glomus cerebriforme]